MRHNFGRNKRKIEETKKSRQEEKRIKKLNKKSEIISSAESETAPENQNVLIK